MSIFSWFRRKKGRAAEKEKAAAVPELKPIDLDKWVAEYVRRKYPAIYKELDKVGLTGSGSAVMIGPSMYVRVKSHRNLLCIEEGTEGPAGYLDGIRNDLDEIAEYIESNIIPRCATVPYFNRVKVEANKECGKWSHDTHIWGTAGQFARYIAELGEAGERYVDIYSRYVADIVHGAVNNIVRGHGRLPELTVVDCDSYATWVDRHPNELSTVGTPGEQVLLGKLAETDSQVVLIGGNNVRST